MEITIEKLIKINELITTYKDDEKEFTKQFTLLVFGSLDVEKSVLDKTIQDFYDSSNNTDLIQRFFYNEVEYGFIPNLSKITAGEFIDLDNYFSVEVKEYHKIAAILYRPVTKSINKYYEIERYEGTDKLSQIMLNVNSQVILGAMVFFWSLSKSLLDHTSIFIQEQVDQMVSQMKINSQNNLDGTQ
jgi:hypothetical protein